jgi:hypothetical protein
MRKLPVIFTTAALIAGGLCAPAAAQTTAYAAGDGGPGPNEIRLMIPVTASVGGRCGFAEGAAPSGNFNQPDFDQTGLDFQVPFSLECTGPSRVAVVSANGGLLTTGPEVPGYTTKAPYNVTLNLVGANAVANATCEVGTLVTGSSCPFLGPASTVQGLRLAATSLNQAGTFLRISAPAYSGSLQLVEGTYVDTLTITVSASP